MTTFYSFAQKQEDLKLKKDGSKKDSEGLLKSMNSRMLKEIINVAKVALKKL